MDLTARVEQTGFGISYTQPVRARRAELPAQAWLAVQSILALRDWGERAAPILVLGVGDGELVEAAVGVHLPGMILSSVDHRLQAELRPGDVHVCFSGDDLLAEPQTRAMRSWLAERGYDEAGAPWALLAPDRIIEVVWPVRPVRDTATFIGRHGPRVDVPDPLGSLAVNRQSVVWDRALLNQRLEALQGDNVRPETLRYLSQGARRLAAQLHVLDADDSEIFSLLTLCSRAGLAATTCDVVRQPLTVELGGRPIRVDHAIRPDMTDVVAAALAGLATGDPVSVGLLRDLPVESLATEPPPPQEWSVLAVTALRAIAREDWRAGAALASVQAAVAK